MADREAKLRLIFELVKAGATQEALAAINAEMTAGAVAAEKTAGALVSTAAAADDVAESEAKAAGETARLAGALTEAGDAATESGQKTASASAQGAQAVQGVTASVEEQAASTREAGHAAVESGREIEGAAREAGSAVDRLTQEWKETIDAAKEAGLALDFDSAVASVQELTAAVRGSGDSLETQRAALSGIGDQLEEDFRAMTAGSKEAGTETTEQAKAIEKAMQLVRGQIAEVDAGMRAVGAAGAEGGDKARTGFLSVADALELANAAAARATTKLDESGRIPAKAIADLAAVIETVNIAMEKTATTSGAATDVQLANVEALKAKLGELTDITNRQTNAGRDNAVALQDESQQVSQLAGAMGSLVNVFDRQQIVSVAVTGQAAKLSQVYSVLKNQVKALDLNTLSAGGSAVKYGGQLAAVAITAKLATDAGIGLAKTNDANREALESLSESVKKYGRDLKENLIDRADGVQAQTQNVIATLLQLDAVIDGLSTREINERNDEVVRKLNQDLVALSIAAGRGQEAAKAFYAILNEGIGTLDAAQAATGKNAEVVALHRVANEQGWRSIEMWRAAVRNAGGDVGALDREMKILREDLGEESRILALMEIEKKKYAEATREQAAATNDHTKALRDNQIAQRASANAAVEASLASLDVQKATDGSSESINILTRTIRDLISASDENTVSLKVQAAELQSQLDQLDGLSAAQRARIQDVIDLAARGHELTAADRAYVEQLTKLIETGNVASVATRERTDAVTELDAAVQGLAESEQRAAIAEEARMARLAEEIDLVREAIAEEERRQGIRREDTAININAGASLDYLRQRERALQEEMTSSLTIVRSSSAAKLEEGDARAKLSAIIEREKEAANGAAAAHGKVTTVLENGRKVITNVTEEMQKNAEKTIEVSAAHEKLGVSAGTTLGAMRDLSTTVPDLTGSMGALKEMAGEVELAFDKAAASIAKMRAQAAAAATK